MRNFKLLNQNGGGLVLVLIICSIVGVATVFLMNTSKESEDKIRLDARVLSYRMLVEQVTNSLHTGNNCTNALQGVDVRNAFHPFKGISVSLDLKLPMNPKILKKPVGRDVWFVEGGTSVKDVELFVSEKVREPVRLDNTSSINYVAAIGHVLIIPGHPGTGAKLARNSHYKIPILIYYRRQGAQRIIDSCFAPNSEAYFCTIQGGAYDWNETNEEYKCQPDRLCFPYKSGIVSSGGCPSSGGRYKATQIGYLGSTLYMCEWCNRRTPIPTARAVGPYYTPYPANPRLPWSYTSITK